MGGRGSFSPNVWHRILNSTDAWGSSQVGHALICARAFKFGFAFGPIQAKPETYWKAYNKPPDVDQFATNHGGEHMSEFLNKTYGGMVVKVKTFWVLAAGKVVKAKNALVFSISSQNACGGSEFSHSRPKRMGRLTFLKFLNKARGPDAIQAKTHGASEKNSWAPRGDVKNKK